jgi:hypothetical protein
MKESTIMHVALREIAHSRSGDKGSNMNIGVIAYSQRGYDYLREQLTEKRVTDFFSTLSPRGVVRYELPNLLALNFVLEGVLDGGGSRSLRTDAQGKAFGQALLEMPLHVPASILEDANRKGLRHE